MLFRSDAKSFFISNLGNKPAVVYSAVDGEALAINTVGDLSQDIALGISTTITGPLTLDFTGMESFTNKNIELVDVVSNIQQNLSNNPSYTFENNVGNVEGRLFLRVTPRAITGQDGTQPAVNVYANEKMVYVNCTEPINQLKITDIKGQLLYLGTNTGGAYTARVPLNIDTQFVLVQVETDKSKDTKKVLIK